MQIISDKEIKKFAWFPIRVTSGKLVWLSSYYEHRMLYDPITLKPPLIGYQYVWTETEKEKVWRLLKE